MTDTPIQTPGGPHCEEDASTAGLPTYTVALAGNPNSGKSTLFNALTGARAHVGNYPGITVEKKSGRVRLDNATLCVVDLPGTYSLTAYSAEELVAREFLVNERPQVVVDVINAGALERNLYLAVQLLELGIPVVLGLNMMDEARKMGLMVDSKRLGKMLGCPVVELVARVGTGIGQLNRAAASLAEARQGSWKPMEISYGPDLDPALAAMTERIVAASHLTAQYPARWVALKYLEGDDHIKEQGRLANPGLNAWLEATAEEAAAHLRTTLDTYPEAVVADYRYGFIASLLKGGVLTRNDVSGRIAVSDKIDLALTHRFLGPAIMLGVLYLVYQVTFTLGHVPMEWLQNLFAWMGKATEAALPDGLVRSLLVDGIIAGVGGVMGFVPLVMLIFLLIAFLEDSGYMARIAYMLDRVFRTFGLHGCSVMPFIISGGIAGGCAVPGVMASRTLRSPKERIATILTAPFMTCGAKLPVFILLAGVFFPRHQAQAMFAMTILGWIMALLVAWGLRSFVVRGQSTPFVMELPPYRLPTWRGLAIHTWERTWQYIKKAGSIILAVSVVVWAAMTFPGLSEERLADYEARKAALTAQSGETAPAGKTAAHGSKDIADQVNALERAQSAETLSASLAGRIGTALEPLSRLAGFDWRTNIALAGGFAAKEIIISTLGTAYSLGAVKADEAGSLADQIAAAGFPLSAGLALMVFILLYSPCVPTVVAIGKETGSWKWSAFAMTFNTVLAFALAVAIYQIGMRLTL